MTPQPVCAFEFDFTPDGRVLVIGVCGKLDPPAVEELTPRVDDAYRGGARRFVFDLSRLDYAGSLALRLFVGLHNRVRGEGAVVLCNPTAALRSVLELTRVNQVLRLYPSRAEAIDAVLA